MDVVDGLGLPSAVRVGEDDRSFGGGERAGQKSGFTTRSLFPGNALTATARAATWTTENAGKLSSAVGTAWHQEMEFHRRLQGPSSPLPTWRHQRNRL